MTALNGLINWQVVKRKLWFVNKKKIASEKFPELHYKKFCITYIITNYQLQLCSSKNTILLTLLLRDEGEPEFHSCRRQKLYIVKPELCTMLRQKFIIDFTIEISANILIL